MPKRKPPPLAAPIEVELEDRVVKLSTVESEHHRLFSEGFQRFYFCPFFLYWSDDEQQVPIRFDENSLPGLDSLEDLFRLQMSFFSNPDPQDLSDTKDQCVLQEGQWLGISYFDGEHTVSPPIYPSWLPKTPGTAHWWLGMIRLKRWFQQDYRNSLARGRGLLADVRFQHSFELNEHDIWDLDFPVHALLHNDQGIFDPVEGIESRAVLQRIEILQALRKAEKIIGKLGTERNSLNEDDLWEALGAAFRAGALHHHFLSEPSRKSAIVGQKQQTTGGRPPNRTGYRWMIDEALTKFLEKEHRFPWIADELTAFMAEIEILKVETPNVIVGRKPIKHDNFQRTVRQVIRDRKSSGGN